MTVVGVKLRHQGVVAVGRQAVLQQGWQPLLQFVAIEADGPVDRLRLEQPGLGCEMTVSAQLLPVSIQEAEEVAEGTGFR